LTITSTASLTNPVRALYNAAALQAFTEKGQFWRGSTIREVAIGEGGIGRGKSIVFDLWTASAVSTSALSETSDGNATALAMTQVEVPMSEYGNYVQTTRKLRLTHYGEPEEHAAWNMGQMASDTLDLLAREALDAQTGATWNDYAGSATSITTITRSDELSAADIRTAFADLRSKHVPPLEGGYYLCYVHPHVLKDLKDETGDASWTKKELYAGERIQPIMDEVGCFEGFRFVMSTNCKLDLKAGGKTTTGAVSADVYTTYFLGQDALGFARNGEVPQIEVSEPVIGPSDAFRRFQVISWYALCGFKALRDDALYKVSCCSSLAANGS
jgi:N4-gp56 family major capsid protein